MNETLAPALANSRWRAVTSVSVLAVEAALAWRIGWTPALAAYGCLGAAMTLAVVIDARTKRMPNVVLVPSYPVGLGLLAAAAWAEGRWWSLGRAAIAMAALAAFYLALALVAGARRMGLADVTLGGLLGLLLGWASWSAVSMGVLLGWLFALVAVVVSRPHRPGHLGTRAVPTGPCLWLGALVALLVVR